MKTGDRVMSQKMMRLRVIAQGSTVFAIVGGVLYQSYKAKKLRESEKNKQTKTTLMSDW